MKHSVSIRNIVELNFAMMFISTSGTLARYIDTPVPITLAFRASLAAILIYLFCKWRRFDFNISKQDRLAIFVGGVLMGLHWITYFYALKFSNVAIGMLSLFTYPVITSFLEPLILKAKFQKAHIVLGGLLLVGIYFLVPDFDIRNDYSKAVALGIISAICYALRNILTKSKVNKYNGSVLMFYQLIIIAIFLSPFFLVLDSRGIMDQLPANLMLALLATAIGHTWFLSSFKFFSITSASIISSTQPIYGIIIGMIFLHEYPTLNTLIGGLLILTSVIIESMRTYEGSVVINNLK